MPVKRFKTSLLTQGKIYGVLSGKELLRPNAVGGTITNSGGYTIHTFTAIGEDTFTIFSGINFVEYLIVAGGGAGGDDIGAGGGAGGLLTGISPVSSNSYSLLVGDGGPSTQGTEGTGRGTDGQNSTALGLTAFKGGAGGGEGESTGNGGSGVYGSGGGCGYNAGTGGAGTPGQGNNGGSTIATGWASGGGGAAAVGVNGNTNVSAHGGNGLVNTLDGNSFFYAGGGGGNIYSVNTQRTGNGGSGGGGGAAPGGINADSLPGLGSTTGRNSGLNGSSSGARTSLTWGKGECRC
jgi:fibronectin-binding autotransporter adhesin